jgi:hypothetical protein
MVLARRELRHFQAPRVNYEQETAALQQFPEQIPKQTNWENISKD